MMLDKEYFDGWMQRLVERLKRIEELCTPSSEQNRSVLPDGDRLLDNYDLCKRFIERNFSNFRNMKKERANNSHGKRQ